MSQSRQVKLDTGLAGRGGLGDLGGLGSGAPEQKSGMSRACECVLTVGQTGRATSAASVDERPCRCGSPGSTASQSGSAGLLLGASVPCFGGLSSCPCEAACSCGGEDSMPIRNTLAIAASAAAESIGQASSSRGCCCRSPPESANTESGPSKESIHACKPTSEVTPWTEWSEQTLAVEAVSESAHQDTGTVGFWAQKPA